MPRGGQNAISEETLLADLRHLADELGRSPSQADINEHSSHSHKTYYRKFDGGLREAKERAGLEMYEVPERKRVTVECATCGAEVERKRSEVENREYVYCSYECKHEGLSERYAGAGNPASTLVEVECDHCGASLERPKWKREANQWHFCDRECYGAWRSENLSDEDSPLWKDRQTVYCKYCGRAFEATPAIAARQRFCSPECKYEARDYSGEKNPSWKGGSVAKQCQFCGEEYEVKPSEAEKSKYCSHSCALSDKTGEDHPRWNPDSESLYYGPNWKVQRSKAIVRDQARCQAIGCERTEQDNLRIYSLGLDVHHLTPLATFKTADRIDYEAANSLDNLLTLCRECHREVETSGSEVRLSKV